jgi:hypothetical protein
MIAQLREANVAFVPSRLVTTADADVAARLPVWVKRADVHNTQDGDVVFAETEAAVAAALAGLAARGIESAVLQPHVAGDLIKFYGVGTGDPADAPPWFVWFYHRDQRLLGHRFDAEELARTARRAAASLSLEVFGGDAIATESGETVIIDLNAWPSFALYRDTAAPRIAAHLAARFRRAERDGAVRRPEDVPAASPSGAVTP